MFYCQKCGSENSPGTVHCVKCHTRLELDKMAPKTSKQRKDESGDVVKYVVTRSIILVIFLAIFGTFALALIPTALPKTAEPQPIEVTAAKTTLSNFNAGLMNQLIFTTDQLSWGLQGTFDGSLSNINREGSFKYKSVAVRAVDKKFLEVVFRYELFDGVWPVSYTLTIDTENPEQLESVSMGWLPLPEPLWATAVVPLLTDLDLMVTLNPLLEGKVKSVEWLSEDQLKFSTKP